MGALLLLPAFVQALAWHEFVTPTEGPPRSIGGYSAGCIHGAVALPNRGEGYLITSPERHRQFGHPLLIAFIEQLGRRLKAAHLPTLRVGDLGQPRGGPAPSGHASHQNGLDVDLAFAAPRGGHPVSMVDSEHERPSPRFGKAVERLLALAVSDASVDRLFVNPVLKRALCERSPRDRRWLHKVRPWWGHNHHFHVRLACPADSPDCVAQPALPPGDGCDEIAWWFSKKDEGERDEGHKSYAAKVGVAPELRPECRLLVAP